jgi:hypothetical protein
MNPKRLLYEVPVASTEFITEAILCGNLIRYSYEKEGLIYKSGIFFKNVKAKRTRTESACRIWHIKDAYDTLVEVENSEWVNEILVDGYGHQKSHNEIWNLHHYMIYIDSIGCIEVISESWNVLPEEQGAWI